ncbi:hypothetical protein BKA67DRAFT_579618 [Truncatella angustata]|uniref:Uncharacterized protein n=1 Tax=Truncatella angustata TaxID=152316 RepID=A0A9P8UDX1_9PEZI|nr:uncharacterized protein BKA67DRAFT_579618 [Truncatella angustata]KAH6648133.1 hypothetical protein BKA67DRAFT_579618 [Truncatella angustata]
MTSLRNILFSLYSLSSLAYAAPLQEDLEGRNLNKLLCALENPIISVLGAKTSATAFCSSYLSIATQTFSATATTSTSTSTTTTVLTGTQVITDPTSTSTIVSSVTTTAVVFTTSDDTAAPTALKRDVNFGKPSTVSVPAQLTKFAATVLSSACSCLSIPTPSVTNTQTVTSTVSRTSTTSTFAGTTTYTPVAYTTTTTTDTATSTSTILKSNVLSTIVAIVNQDNYQSFCSDILAYTTPVTTAYETTTATTAVTASKTTTVTSYATITTTVVQGAAKRQESGATDTTSAATTNATPVELATYPADYVTSACSMAVTSPATSTISSTITVTTTQTSVQLATVTAQATSVITKTCAKYPVSNSGFETGTFSGWTYYNPIGGAGGSWSIVSGGYSSSYAAQLTMLNPDTSKYGGFAGYITQNVATCVGLSYTVSFNYDCTTVNNGLAIYAWGGGGNSGQFSCPSAGNWYSTSWTFTATSTSTAIYVEGVQNGVARGTILFDNIVVTLNQ